MKVALALTSSGLGVAAIVSIVACSGGPGTANTDLRGGPDGIPKSSTDSPGGGNEQPGSSNQDSPGSSTDNPGSSCLDCSGTYQCFTPGSTDVSYVTLAPVANGCSVFTAGESSNSADVSTLVCGGQFVVTEGGTSTVAGQWSGGTGRFSVNVSLQGQTISVTCQLTNVTPPQQGGTVSTGGNNGADAG